MDANMKVEIDLMQDGVYIIKQGHLTKLLPIEYGIDEITWNKNTVLEVTRSKRVRLTSGREIV